MTLAIIFAPLKIIFSDFLSDLIYFPIWWYSRGAKRALFFCFNKIKEGERWLGLGIWISNLFRPMFGQYDFAGRLISFFIRLIQIIVRLALFLIWTGLMIILFLLWFFLPLFIIYQLIVNLV